jgi:hypothetical protein
MIAQYFSRTTAIGGRGTHSRKKTFHAPPPWVLLIPRLSRCRCLLFFVFEPLAVSSFFGLAAAGRRPAGFRPRRFELLEHNNRRLLNIKKSPLALSNLLRCRVAAPVIFVTRRT